jgi:hypothetical protein
MDFRVDLGGETITILSAGTVTDPYSGEAAESWDTPTERDVVTIAPPEPRPSQEPVQDARNAVTDGWTLYLPAGDPVTRSDRVRVRGEVYPVQGQPADWGVGVVVQAFRTEG